ncbi:MAG: serine hydrolase domain-containing protein, partial [Pseudomonadota bacterium]
MRRTSPRSLGIALIVWAVGVPSQAGAEALIGEDALTEFVAEGQASWEVPGIAVAAIAGDHVVTVTRGNTRLDDGLPITADTAFAIASTTKAMLAAGLAILVDRDALAWDEPVTQYFPELELADGYVTRQLRVIDLLTHSTGIPSTDYWTFSLGMPMDAQIARLDEVEPTAAYRQRFQYQNTMYEVAGELIERLTGEPWHQFLAKQLWQPLAMTN